jgi:hypothetical protein
MVRAVKPSSDDERRRATTSDDERRRALTADGLAAQNPTKVSGESAVEALLDNPAARTN